MFRLSSIFIALALPILGMAQTCIEDGVEFDFGAGTINQMTFSSACSPNTLSAELSMCELNSITVNLAGAIDPNLLVIDIIHPNATCTVRFVNELYEIYDQNGYVYEACFDPSFLLCSGQLITYPSGSYTFDLDLSSFPVTSLEGTWDISLYYISTSFTITETDEISFDFVGSCCLEVPGCTYSNACNYDASATYDDGTCDFDSCVTVIVGCTYSTACNYNLLANYDDGSCEYTTCAGCMNTTACDYDPDATIAAVCNDFSSCYGCMDVTAENFDPLATIDSGSCVFNGCTIEVACNFDVLANTNDGSCVYANLGYDCFGECLDTDGDGYCDYLDFNTDILEVSNEFLDMSYVANAAPFISVYDGWLDADFVTIGICRPYSSVDLESSTFLDAEFTDFQISILFDDFSVLDYDVIGMTDFQFDFLIDLNLDPTLVLPITASQIVGITLIDNLGTVLDRLYQDVDTPWPNVTLDGINHAPGQHRVVRQPWVLQGNTEVEESEWLVCDENWAMPFYSSWNLEPIIYVPLDPNSDAMMPEYLNDLDDDGIPDQLEMPVFCQNVNTTNYSPLYYTLICDEAELIEYWISSFNLSEIAEDGGVLPPLPPVQQPEASAMVASDVCTSGASQLAYCNYGQRAFVVDENNQMVQIIDYGDLANPSPIDDLSGGFLSILADDMSTELTNALVPDIQSLVPADVDIFNVVGPDDTTYCCSTMVAVAWIDTLSLINSGWVTLHDLDGGLLDPTDAIIKVGPSPRSLAFSQDGTWLVVACSGEGEHEGLDDPLAEIVCIDVTGYTQGTGEPVVDYPIDFHDGSHIVGNFLTITGGAHRTSIYSGPNTHLSYVLEPSHVAITPDSKRAFVNCQVNNTMVEVNLDNVILNDDVIVGAYGFGRRDMAEDGFDGKNDGEALVESPPSGTIQGWCQPGDMVIDTTEFKTYLLTANEGLPSKDTSGDEEVITLSGGDYDGLEIDPDYNGGLGISYVFGSRSFTIWDITTPGSPPTPLYDSGSLIEGTLALLMPDYANSLKSTYDSGDEASVSRGPEPAGIAFGTLNDKKILIVSLEEMGGSMIFDLLNYEDPSTVSASYQAYATHRDFQNPSMDICAFNHLGAKDVLFLPKSITDNTSVSGINEGYDAIMVSNDETGSLTLFRLDSNLDIPGCMDSCACNYNDNATLNDGSCDFDSCVLDGCTYPDADNYDPLATLDIGTCVFTNDCPADINGDGFVSTGDLLEFLADYGITCP